MKLAYGRIKNIANFVVCLKLLEISALSNMF